MNSACPICHVPALVQYNPEGIDASDIQCPRCGSFQLSGSAMATLPNKLWKDRKDGNVFNATKKPDVPQEIQQSVAVLSHMVKLAQLSEPRPMIMNSTVDHILASSALPSLSKQREKLLLWLNGRMTSPGDTIIVDPWSVGAAIGAADNMAVMMLLASLEDEGLARTSDAIWHIHKCDIHGGAKTVNLTLKGWEKIEGLERTARTGQQAFMAMKFGDPELDDLVNVHFRHAIKQTGFNLFRLDDQSVAGLIDHQLRKEIKESHFLIADLSHANAGAYWEAGYAEGLGKPVIYTCRKSIFDDPTTRPHFDTNHHLTLMWDPSDPDMIVKALKKAVRDTIPESKQHDDP